MGHCISKNGSVAVEPEQHSGSNQQANDSPQGHDADEVDPIALPAESSIPDRCNTKEVSDDCVEMAGASVDDSWSVSRSKRSRWKGFLEHEYWENLFASNHTEAQSSQALYDLKALRGESIDFPEEEPRVFAIFLSSTFTDTEAERNLLIEDVQPFLRDVCSLFGYEFRFCEMRWGVRDEASEDHQTVNLCMQELLRCQRESCGINFITFLCDKYGYCPFPSEIPEKEFEELLNHVTEESSIELLRKWFRLDTNKEVPIYILQKISSILEDYNSKDIEKRKAARDSWWNDFETMQTSLKNAAKFISFPDRKQFYQVSVTELEVFNGLLNVTNPNEKAFMINRVITDIEQNASDSAAGKFIDIDWGSKSIKTESRMQLLALKNQKVMERLDNSRIWSYNVNWCKKGISTETHLGYLHKMSDIVCQVVFDSIKSHMLEKKKESQKMSNNSVTESKRSLTDEIMHGAAFLKRWSKNIVDRNGILDKIKKYCAKDEGSVSLEFKTSEPLIMFGESGAGKSTVMASAIKNAVEKQENNTIIIFRLIGSTPDAGQTMNLLESITSQLKLINGENADGIGKPDNFNSLINNFKQELNALSDHTSIIIFLDALDQLTDVDMISEIEWLPKQLPRNVHIVISCTPNSYTGTTYFNYLQSCVSETNFIEVAELEEDTTRRMLQKWLQLDKRKMTQEQTHVIESSFKNCPLPLFMRIAYGETKNWHSYTDTRNHPILHATNIEELITQLFHRLTVIHGKPLFEKGIAYLTAAKDGLSRQELEDILSCDEEVLEDVFQWWVPPIRRLPSLQLVRFLSDLEDYLMETVGFSDGILLLRWFHRQFKQHVETMMQMSQNIKDIHETLAMYFNGHWAQTGKAYFEEEVERIADRKLPRNPLFTQGSAIKTLKAARSNLSFVEFAPGDCQINTRRLRELCFHLIKACLWQEVGATLCDLKYIQAKAMLGQLNELREEYTSALSDPLTANWRERDDVEDFYAFLLQKGHVISRYPSLVYQEAANYKEDSTVKGTYDACSEKPAFFFKSLCKSNDAFLRVIMQEHNDAVLCVSFQRTTENFETSRSLKDLLVTGSFDGRVKIWSYLSASVVSSIKCHTKAVNACDLLDALLLTISADAKLCLRNVDALNVISSWVVSDDNGGAIAGNMCRLIPIGGIIYAFSAWDDGVIRIGNMAGEWVLKTEGENYAATCFSINHDYVMVGYADGELLNFKVETTLQDSLSLQRAGGLNNMNGLKEVFDILQFDDMMIISGKERQLRIQYSEDSGSAWAKNQFKNDQDVKKWVSEGINLTAAIQKKMDAEMASKGTFVVREKDDASLSCILEGLPTPYEYTCIDVLSPYLATGGSDGSVRLWAIDKYETGAVDVHLILELGRHNLEVNSLRFSHDGAYLASVSDDTDVRIWDIGLVKSRRSDGMTKTMKTKYRITGCTTDEGGSYCATWGNRGLVSMWLIAESRCLWTKICCSGENINSAAITPGGGKVMVAGDNYYQLLNGETGVTYDVPRSCVGRKVRVCSFSSDGRIALLTDSCAIRLVVVEPEMKPIGFDDTVWEADTIQLSCAQFGKEICHVISGSVNGKVKLWTEDQECILEIHIGGPIICLIAEPALRKIACIFEGDTMHDFASNVPLKLTRSNRKDADRPELLGEKDDNYDGNNDGDTQKKDGEVFPDAAKDESKDNELGVRKDTQNVSWFLPDAPGQLTVETDFKLTDEFPMNDTVTDNDGQSFMPPPMSEEMLLNLQKLQEMFMNPPDPSEFSPPDLPSEKPGPHRLQKKEKRHVQYQPRKTPEKSTVVILNIKADETRIVDDLMHKTRLGLQNCVLSTDGMTLYCSSATGYVFAWRLMEENWFDIARFVTDEESFISHLGPNSDKILVSSGENIDIISVIEN